jgi:SOS-response transcriptional repressor LexA
MKIPALSQWVTLAAKKVGGQAELSRLISKELRRDIDRAAVNKMCSGDRRVYADEMLAIESVSEIAVPSPSVPQKIPLVDWVSAGKLAEPGSQMPTNDVPLLAFADLGRGDFIALRVQGDSMDRISPDGSTVVINRDDKTLVAGKPYVFSLRGETTYKLWQPDTPPYLQPYSTNPMHKLIFVPRKRDFAVVGRVKRTSLDL